MKTQAISVNNNHDNKANTILLNHVTLRGLLEAYKQQEYGILISGITNLLSG